MGDAVTLRQVVHRHLEAVEHRGLLATHHALAGHVQVVEDPVALAVRHGSLAERLVQMPAGARRIGAEPVALQAHRHVRDAHVLAGILDAVVVVVLPHHAGDVRLGDAEQAVAVGQRALPVQVGPEIISSQFGVARLISIEELGIASAIVDRTAQVGALAQLGRRLLSIVLVEVEQLARGVPLLVAEDRQSVLVAHVLEIVHRGRVEPICHFLDEARGIGRLRVGTGTGRGVGREGSSRGGRSRRSEHLGRERLLLARLHVDVSARSRLALAARACVVAVEIGAQTRLGILLVQAIAALVAEAVGTVGHGTVIALSEQILVLAGVGRIDRIDRIDGLDRLLGFLGHVPVVDVGTRGVRRLGGGGGAAQDDEVAGLLARLFQKRRQDEVPSMQLILHVRPQTLGIVVEVGVHPIVHRIVHMLQRRRPHIGVGVAHDLGLVGEQYLERLAERLVVAGAVGHEVPVAVLVGHIEGGARHVGEIGHGLAHPAGSLLVLASEVQGLVGGQRLIGVPAEAVAREVVGARQLHGIVLAERPVATPDATLGRGRVLVDERDAFFEGVVDLVLASVVEGRPHGTSVLGLQNIQLPEGLAVSRSLLLGATLRERLELGLYTTDEIKHSTGSLLQGSALFFGYLFIFFAPRFGHVLDCLVLLLRETGVGPAALAERGLPVAGAGLVVPVALQADDGAGNALLALLHDAVGVGVVPDVAVDEHRHPLGEAGVEGALVVHTVGQVVVVLTVGDRVGRRENAGVQIGILVNLLGHDRIDLGGFAVVVHVVGQLRVEGS